MCVWCVCVCLLAEARRGHWVSLELELQEVVRYPVWVLGAKLGSSARAVHPFNL